jgi:hypothetical protein
LDWQHDCKTDHFLPEKHRSVAFMDLRCKLFEQNDFLLFEFSPFVKPNNAYSYIPFNSSQPDHQKFGWIKAELLRLLTHCSTKETWSSQIKTFAGNLLLRGYPLDKVKQTFRKVKWSDRSNALHGIMHRPQIYSTKFQRGNVFVADFRPGFSSKQFSESLRQTTLHEAAPEIFSESLNLIFRGGQQLGSFLPIINYRICQ